MSVSQEMQAIAKQLLESGEVKMVIGWEKGTHWYQSPPAFIENPQHVGSLIWDEFCVNNLAKYLMEYRFQPGKVAVFVKGCDSRGINRLIQDYQLDREKIYLIGVPCSGMRDKDQVKDHKNGRASDLPLLEKCVECAYPNPVGDDIDQMIGSPVSKEAGGDRFGAVNKLEAMSPDERYDYWASQYDKCIRCYACRNSCPACNCKECIFESDKKGWVLKAADQSANTFYNVTRGFHVAGRCIECGECERVCPMNIPIMSVNKKFIKDANELFGEYDAGVSLDKKSPLGQFKESDPEEFM